MLSLSNVDPINLGTVKISAFIFTFCHWPTHIYVGPAFRASKLMLHSLKQSGLIHKSIWESDEGGLCNVQCFVTFLTHFIVVTTLLNKWHYLHMHMAWPLLEEKMTAE